MTQTKVCPHFARGKCRFGIKCKFSHELDGSTLRDQAPNSTALAVCRFYQSPRGCSKGSTCRFLHGTSKEGAQPRTDTTSNAEDMGASFRKWRYMVPLGHAINRPLGTQRLSQFFRSAYDLVSARDIGTTQQIITSLASEGGLSRIGEVANTLAVNPEVSKSSYFEDILLPFCRLITHDDVLSSLILENSVGTIYNFIFGINGTRAVPLFGSIAAMLVHIKSDKDREEPSLSESFSSVLTALARVIDTNQTACVTNGFQEVVETITTCISDCSRDMMVDVHMHNAFRSLGRIRARLSLGSLMPSSRDVSTKAVNAPAEFQLRQEMPGTLAVTGPRHDNDHENITDIKVLPTAEEIQSNAQEYIPVNDPRKLHLPGVDGLIDRHFRLLREDTVGQLRDAVRLVLERLRNESQYASAVGRNGQGTRVFVHERVSLTDLKFERKKGLQVTVEFDQPQAARKSSTAKQRAEFWNDSKQLQVDALLCLVDSNGKSMFFSVSERADEYKSGKELSDGSQQAPTALWDSPVRAALRLQPIDFDGPDIVNILQRFQVQDRIRQVLVEFPGVLLPSFRPTLQALQQMSHRHEMPFSEFLAPPEINTQVLDIQPPPYALERGFNFELASITDGTALRLSCQDPFDLQALKESSSLDDAQCVALVHALTKRLSLIQGPPGTGKSYVGVKVVKVLLANRKEARLGPIICICYTNHALDQILESLIADGAKQVIRLGSRSRSEVLAPLNLFNVAGQIERTKVEKHRIWESQNELEQATEEVNGLISELSNAHKLATIKKYLQMNHPRHHSQLSDRDENGFKVVYYGSENAISLWLKSGSGSVQSRPIAGLLDVDLSHMSNTERQKLYEFWLQDIRSEITEKLVTASTVYNSAKSELEKCRQEINLRCLQQAYVIGVTTTGLAKNLNLLRRVRSKVLLCEEAGEVLEAHTLTALLPSIEHCILIGDHEQLRPHIQNHNLSVESPSGKKYALDMSLFERMIRPIRPGVQIPFSTLALQRRMHPSIADLIRQTLYPKLKDHASVQEYPMVHGMRRRLYWLDHHEKEVLSNQVSRSNDFEVEMVAALVSHLVRQGTYRSKELAVLTPYLPQLRKIRKRLSSAFEIVVGDRDLEQMEKEGFNDAEADISPEINVAQKTAVIKTLRVSTVDNFQGEEADVVIISLVRSNEERRCGFLKTSNRINVLLSRARHGMYIIGNTETSRHVEMWNRVISIFEQAGNVGSKLPLLCPRHPNTAIEVSTPDDFLRLAPEGGCHLQCEWRLDCGHSCVNKCHARPLHDAVVCLERCQRSKPDCNHSCPRPCGEKCDELCLIKIESVVLLCGHTAKQLNCYQTRDIAAVRCRHKVEKTVPGCGHIVRVDCSQDTIDRNFECNAICGDILPCGHPCSRACHECKARDDTRLIRTDHGVCTTPCGRPYNTCAHECSMPCHGTDCPPCDRPCDVRCAHSRCNKKCNEPCPPCAEDCDVACIHQGRCEMPCAVPCDLLPCSERCQQTLSCGHQCPSICSEICPTPKQCQTCAPAEVKNSTVDYIMDMTYGELDLDESPVIIPSCGHIITVESLDGHMSMRSYYEFSEEGAIITYKTALEPFSADGLKRCPLCRGPLRNIRRYGQIIKRGLIDESTKKFIIWANTQFVPLEKRLHTLERQLGDSKAVKEEPQPTKEFAPQVAPETGILTAGPLLIEGSRDQQIATVYKHGRLSSRYRKLVKLRREIARFLKDVSEAEQPFGRIIQMIRDIRRRQGVMVQDHIEQQGSKILQVRNRLLATVLSLRCDLAILSDYTKAHLERANSVALKLDLAHIRGECLTLATEAISRNQPMHEIEGRVFFAQSVAIECSAPAMDPEQVAALVASARDQLARAKDVCESAASTRSMRVEIENAENSLRDGTFYQVVSNEEKRQVYAAMEREFRGTGHWYYCQNGHPFTIGECGMPMQTSRCPQCDAPVGGTDHQAVDGIQRAEDLERQFGGLGV